MELKEFQQRTLVQVKQYLELFAKEKEAGNIRHASLDAWQGFGLYNYRERQNGLGQDLPNFCLKIPTGGGKTFLAVKTIDLINTIVREKRTGLILWIVPTNQIYTQTIQNLRNREHSYRQHLDIASGGRTLILERTNSFSPQDVEQSLVVLMLMLPAASRQNKETLRMFRDSGSFQSFFPPEDDIKGHEKLLEQVTNLDTYGDENNFWGRQIKTSLGNTLRLLSPIIVLDEGHKAYSETAQGTLRGFNPSIILELSATPSPESNILVDVRGIELSREEMIKLDLHIVNKASPDWKDTMLASIEKRNFLEQKARDYEGNTGKNIRPMCLVQVERTGKDQRGGKFIHSEDVRDYLTKTAGVPDEQVAVTSAELKEIKGVDLFAKDCPIRYIITKQALQEGWDCSFAYILTVLTNPTSKNALTQLVGRILRQPEARKTKVVELDESYVFTFQQRAISLLASIRGGFEQEGLGDLAGRIVADETLEGEAIGAKEKIYETREKFKSAANQTILPVFVLHDNQGWRTVNYEMDIASRVIWDKLNLEPMYTLALSKVEETNLEVAIGLSEDEKELIRQRAVIRTKEGGLRLDSVFLTRHLLEIVPNPWIASELGERVIRQLLKKYDEKLVINNFVFIIEELRKYLEKEKDRLAKDAFSELLAKDFLRFLIIGEDLGFRLPKKIVVKTTSKTLTRSDGEPLQQSLFDFVPEEDFNEMEKAVAWYIEDQERLFFWYRNAAKQDYAVQGWRRQKIYPDFIFTTQSSKNKSVYDKVFIVETKGIHLKNEDTSYKQSIFDICNSQAKQKRVNDLSQIFKGRQVQFEVIFGDEWKRRLNELLR